MTFEDLGIIVFWTWDDCVGRLHLDTDVVLDVRSLLDGVLIVSSDVVLFLAEVYLAIVVVLLVDELVDLVRSITFG